MVWVRHFQITEETPEDGSTRALETELVEIGPRFTLNPVRILSGSFNGATIWDNLDFVTPSSMRAYDKYLDAREYTHGKKKNAMRRLEKQTEKYQVPKDKLAGVFNSNEEDDGADFSDSDEE